MRPSSAGSEASRTLASETRKVRSGRPLRDGSSSPFPAANRGRGWEAPEGHLCEQRSGDMHEAQVPVSAPGRPCLSPSVWSSAFRVASGSLWLCLSLCLPPGRAQHQLPSVARRGRPGRWQEGPMAQKAPPHLRPPPLRLFLLGLPRPPQPHRQSLLAPGGTLIGKARSRWHKRDRGSRRWPRGPLRAGARLAP